MNSKISKAQQQELLNKLSAIPLDDRDVLVQTVLEKIDCPNERIEAVRQIYTLFLKVDLMTPAIKQ